MQSTAINLEFKLNINLRLVKPDFMQSTAVNLEFKLKVIFKLLSCNRPCESRSVSLIRQKKLADQDSTVYLAAYVMCMVGLKCQTGFLKFKGSCL